MRSIGSSVAMTAVTVLLAACGSSPTEPTSSQGPRTTVKITVTKCDLGGSVVVLSDGGSAPITLPTPGEATLSLTPGPHSLSYQRGNQVFGGNVIGTADPLGTIPPGATASIVLVDPPGACFAAPH
jgi:ABC-type Fe3+-hydroxamate transport system substrate-binding protein